MQILSDRIIWNREDFLAGFIPDPAASFRWNETGAMNMTNIDAFGPNGIGVIMPGRNPTSRGTANTSELISIDMDPEGNSAYALGTDLHQFDVTTDVLTKDATWPHSISWAGGAGSGTAGQVVFYHTAATARAVLYSYNTATTGNVGMYDVVSNVFDDDFMSTVPTSGTTLANVMHPLCVTSDDRTLMGDYRSNQGKIHSYKGVSNTMEVNVLNLPFNMKPVGIVEEENGFDTVVFATTSSGLNRRGKAKAFWWSIDRPASWYKSSPIPDDECAAPFVAYGTVGCFTRSRTTSSSGSGDRMSVLRLFEGGQWVPKYHWNGGLPVVDGVEIQDHTVVWNSDGVVHRWGPRWNKYPAAAFQETRCSGTHSGFIKSLSNATTVYKLYASSAPNTPAIENFAGFNTANWRGCAAAPTFSFGKKGKVIGSMIHLAGGSAGGGRTIKLSLVNEAFTASPVFSDLGSFTSTEALKRYLPEQFTTRVIEFSAISPFIEWETGSGSSNASAIERLEVFFEEVDIRT